MPRQSHSSLQFFRDLDLDNSGFLSFDELQVVVRQRLAVPKSQISDDLLTVLWCVLDADDSNQVLIDELGRFLKGDVRGLLDARAKTDLLQSRRRANIEKRQQRFDSHFKLFDEHIKGAPPPVASSSDANLPNSSPFRSPLLRADNGPPPPEQTVSRIDRLKAEVEAERKAERERKRAILMHQRAERRKEALDREHDAKLLAVEKERAARRAAWQSYVSILLPTGADIPYDESIKGELQAIAKERLPDRKMLLEAVRERLFPPAVEKTYSGRIVHRSSSGALPTRPFPVAQRRPPTAPPTAPLTAPPTSVTTSASNLVAPIAVPAAAGALFPSPGGCSAPQTLSNLPLYPTEIDMLARSRSSMALPSRQRGATRALKSFHGRPKTANETSRETLGVGRLLELRPLSAASLPGICSPGMVGACTATSSHPALCSCAIAHAATEAPGAWPGDDVHMLGHTNTSENMPDETSET